ncbi:MAG: hypothetical protein JJE07_04585 [Flavobacteriaceae bacterium]|nr:hypothetical protein [Flavobacteriaceae bacterium]
MSEEKLIYDVVVGYMLKVIKSGTKITKFQKEFDAIKHGDYVCFINLIGAGIPNDIVVSKEGEIIPTEKQIEIKNADFVFLLLSSISLKNFYSKCYKEFGEIHDSELTNNDFENLANFEMVLRMFYNNIFITENRINLIDVINILLSDREVPTKEIEIVQKGREFLNMVKGHKAKFSSTEEGLIAFSKALDILEMHEITVTV